LLKFLYQLKLWFVRVRIGIKVLKQ